MKKKSLPKLKKELQILVNKSVRLRDSQCGYCRCISCNETVREEDCEAGHLYSVGSYDSLRFDADDNINAQCRFCNCHKSGNLKEYAKNLRLKIGDERFEALQHRAAESKKSLHFFKPWQLEELIVEYKQKVKDLELGENLPF